ncbi:MAG: hypothetical protein WA756_04325, partial [Pseudolabrys sp.]
ASSPTCFQASQDLVAKLIAAEHLTYEKVSLTSSWQALTYSSHLWSVVGHALRIMWHSFYTDVEALLHRY